MTLFIVRPSRPGGATQAGIYGGRSHNRYDTVRPAPECRRRYDSGTGRVPLLGDACAPPAASALVAHA